ncbi:TonB-dependent siderophore receptor [Pseudoduganella sp. DS3]|uniref:TonB-dependent siderophore receptor n=1 Tax=Pseudoduganella guangdongensis TaxID=2692179 RepID=A0A6N9HB48_9BURK|nr:TonB-dependent receptor [Pseudoduganella guangdongensis]MYN00656.1 TonB-dependent siderophore receptor [Pseudoduganella guangdongensis]
MNTHLSSIAAAAAILCAAPAAASDDITLPSVTVNGTADSSLGLARQNATGSRLGLSIAETPASVEALDTDTIRARGDLLVKEAITRTTGLTDSSSPGNGISYSARGFNGNSSVAMLEDGQRLLVGSGTATGPSDPWGYDYIEVLRGPGSIVYGSGTTGATINAVRKAPQRASSFEALAGFGGGRALRGGLGASGAVGGQGAFRVDAYADRSDGFIDRGEARRAKLLTSAAFDLAPGLDLNLQLDHSEQKPQRYFGTPLVNGRIAGELRDQNYNVGDALIKYVDDKGVVRLAWQATPALSISNELAYIKARRNWRNVESYAYDPLAKLVERSDYIAIRHDQEHTGNRLEARWNQGAHRVVGGWEVATINFTHTNNSPYGGASTVAPTNFNPGVFNSPDPFRPNFNTDTVSNALYVEDAYALNEQWLLLAGLRHDRYRIERTSLLGAAGFTSTLNANAVRLGATWKLAPGTSLYAQASTGSDPVTSLLSLNLANSRYKLTRARQLEAGVKQSLAQGKAEWTAALYRIRKDDIITRDPANPAQSIQGGSQTSQGAEFTASAALAPGWRLDANAAYTDAAFDQLIESGNVSRAGKRPANVPKVSANAWLGYRAEAWRAAAGLRHVGKRFIDNSNVQALPAYTTFDASLGWNVNRRMQVQLNLRNLGDKLYALTSYGDSQYLLGERRHAELTVQWHY